MKPEKITVCFVADGPVLEAYSFLLVSSLRRHHPDPETLRIKAFISVPRLAELSPATAAFYAENDVEPHALPDPGTWWAQDYPHGNKILACAACEDDHLIFMDTDMVCVGPLFDVVTQSEAHISAAPEGVPSWGKREGDWERAYGHFGLEVPEDRITLTRGRRISYLPYFNAGFIYFRNQVVAGSKTLGQMWLETASAFDHECQVEQKRPWLDQITLPLTVFRHELSYHVLSDLYNFSLSNRKRVGRARKARVLHYHRARFLKLVPNYDEVIDDIERKTPPALWGHVAGALEQVGHLPKEEKSDV